MPLATKNSTSNRRRQSFKAAVLILAAFCAQRSVLPAQQPQRQSALDRREVIDMEGRRVLLPARINRIVTIGPVPVINSYVFTFGEGEKIVNGLPINFTPSRYQLETHIVPALADKPRIDGGAPGGTPSIEQILTLAPDVVLGANKQTADLLARNGLAAVCLTRFKPEDILPMLRVLGQVLNKPDVAEEYARYYEQLVGRVTAIASSIPPAQRQRAFYYAVHGGMSYKIIDWWIETGGAISLNDDGSQSERRTFTKEQILAWNPDVIFVSSTSEVAETKSDPLLQKLKAVVNGRVYAVPVGVHYWGQNTSENVLSLLWAAKAIYPDRYREFDMIKEMQRFYSEFYHYNMSSKEAMEMLNGRPY